ncbi:PepSY-associated TM helix domain-containing protein [Alcanivorax jadensis]|uniref:PepSY-associated TM helix domain-containing protein n=1 Tax=Alcanivorax jadensis TaxID=64988 RepID=UPI002354E2F4|nr:PepSY-associated TM helix domain-containing protein [Alcanivorax jadensis]
MKQRKPTGHWRRWHRWLGLLVALPVLVLSVTGVLLNHIESLDWADDPLPSWLARSYGVPLSEQIHGSQVDGHWYAQTGERLFMDGSAVASCLAPFQGAVAAQGLTVAGCGGDLLLLQGSEQVERLRPGQGVPAFTRLGVAGEALVLETENRLLRFGLENLNSVVLAVPDWQPVVIEPLPAVLQPRLQAASVPESLNWQRLLQDLHAGRVFGWAGQLVMDLAALLLVILALTGVIIWSRSR